MDLLAEHLLGIGLSLPDANLYVFGSITSDQAIINDVDVLVVYRSAEAFWSASRTLKQLGQWVPLDVTYMTETEENAFQFVASQRALPVDQLVELRSESRARSS